MTKLHKQFEALPEIESKLVFIDDFHGNKYHSINNSSIVDFINGAWYAFQEQQKIIDYQNQRAVDQAAHLQRVQEHNAKLQKRLKENRIPWQDLI